MKAQTTTPIIIRKSVWALIKGSQSIEPKELLAELAKHWPGNGQLPQTPQDSNKTRMQEDQAEDRRNHICSRCTAVQSQAAETDANNKNNELVVTDSYATAKAFVPPVLVQRSYGRMNGQLKDKL
ncbi:hypothetical protein Trydic_g9191 [Trypoxylus dichotomus]